VVSVKDVPLSQSALVADTLSLEEESRRLRTSSPRSLGSTGPVSFQSVEVTSRIYFTATSVADLESHYKELKDALAKDCNATLTVIPSDPSAPKIAMSRFTSDMIASFQKYNLMSSSSGTLAVECGTTSSFTVVSSGVGSYAGSPTSSPATPASSAPSSTAVIGGVLGAVAFVILLGCFGYWRVYKPYKEKKNLRPFSTAGIYPRAANTAANHQDNPLPKKRGLLGRIFSMRLSMGMIFPDAAATDVENTSNPLPKKPRRYIMSMGWFSVSDTRDLSTAEG